MIENNGVLPRELYAIERTEEILSKLSFPFDRISVSVEFDYLLSEPTSHKLEVNKLSNTVVGEVLLRYNGLYIWQDPSAFYKESIPHELAHVLDWLSCYAAGYEVNSVHGDNWVKWVSKIDSSLYLGAAHEGQFDSRPIRLVKGGIPATCECAEGDEAFEVFSTRGKSKARLLGGEEECPDCQCEYKPMAHDMVPAGIASQMDFIRKASSLIERHTK